MILENLVNNVRNTHQKLSGKFDHLYYSSLAFLPMSGLDTLSTSLCIHKYGIDEEKNNLAKYCMEQFGIDAGLIINKISVVVAVLGIGYLLNKACEDNENRVLRNIGSAAVYAITLTGAPIVINNFGLYFQ